MNINSLHSATESTICSSIIFPGCVFPLFFLLFLYLKKFTLEKKWGNLAPKLGSSFFFLLDFLLLKNRNMTLEKNIKSSRHVPSFVLSFSKTPVLSSARFSQRQNDNQNRTALFDCWFLEGWGWKRGRVGRRRVRGHADGDGERTGEEVRDKTLCPFIFIKFRLT